MTIGIQRLIWQMEGVWDSYHRAVFTAGDVDTAVAVTTRECVLRNEPMHTGSVEGELRQFLRTSLVPHLPADLAFQRVSRTVDQQRLVAEAMVSFIHDREVPWLLPGVAATGRHAEVRAISVVTFAHTTSLGTVTSRISAVRTLWDMWGLTNQLGVPDDQVV